MRFRKGEKIRVRPSKSLGTPPTLATIQKIIAPIGDKDYPQGLALVLTHDDRQVGAEVDCLGYVYSGPPLNGKMVKFP